MTVTVTGGALAEVAADLHILMMTAGTTRLAGDAAGADRATGGAITRLLANSLFAGKAAETAILTDRKSTRLNSSHIQKSRMPSSA